MVTFLQGHIPQLYRSSRHTHIPGLQSQVTPLSRSYRHTYNIPGLQSQVTPLNPLYFHIISFHSLTSLNLLHWALYPILGQAKRQTVILFLGAEYLPLSINRNKKTLIS